VGIAVNRFCHSYMPMLQMQLLLMVATAKASQMPRLAATQEMGITGAALHLRSREPLQAARPT